MSIFLHPCISAWYQNPLQAGGKQWCKSVVPTVRKAQAFLNQEFKDRLGNSRVVNSHTQRKFSPHASSAQRSGAASCYARALICARPFSNVCELCQDETGLQREVFTLTGKGGRWERMGREPECTCIQRPQVGVGFLPKLRGHLDVSTLYK